MKNKTFAAILLVACLIGVAAAAIYENYVVPTTGTTIVKLDVTWVSNSLPVTTIEWGSVINGEPATLELINIENTGNTPCTLELTYPEADWSPSIASLLLEWDYITGTPIDPGFSVDVTLTQTITAPSGDFDYNTVFIATAVTP